MTLTNRERQYSRLVYLAALSQCPVSTCQTLSGFDSGGMFDFASETSKTHSWNSGADAHAQYRSSVSFGFFLRKVSCLL